ELVQDEGFRKDPPQLLVWEFPERYLPMASDLSQFDADWVAQLKASGGQAQRLNEHSQGCLPTGPSAPLKKKQRRNTHEPDDPPPHLDPPGLRTFPR
ncbi:hypothetical protein ACV34N_31525, partial [Pseudomonas aeruginosa]